MFPSRTELCFGMFDTYASALGEKRRADNDGSLNRMIARFSVHSDKVLMSILRSHEDERTAATPHSIRNETSTVAMTLICPIENVPSLSAEAPPAF